MVFPQTSNKLYKSLHSYVNNKIQITRFWFFSHAQTSLDVPLFYRGKNTFPTLSFLINIKKLRETPLMHSASILSVLHFFFWGAVNEDMVTSRVFTSSPDFVINCDLFHNGNVPAWNNCRISKIPTVFAEFRANVKRAPGTEDKQTAKG